MARSPRPTSPPEQPSRLKVPLTDAIQFLKDQIAAGGELAAREVQTQEDLTNLEREVGRWRDLNRTWLDERLGGVAAREYRDASTHFTVGGRLSPAKELEFLRIYLSGETNKLQSIQDRLPLWAQDSSASPTKRITVADDSEEVFVVHGSDEGKAALVAREIDRNTDRTATILHEQSNEGRTVIEKLEDHAAQASYAVVILTGDDVGGKVGEPQQPRARQNVVFEMGLFFGLIGRKRVCVLYEPGVEKPSDIDGLMYIEFDRAGAWKTKLLTEMRKAGVS